MFDLMVKLTPNIDPLSNEGMTLLSILIEHFY